MECSKDEIECNGKCTSIHFVCCSEPETKSCNEKCIQLDEPCEEVCDPPTTKFCNGTCIPGPHECCQEGHRQCHDFCIREEDICCNKDQQYYYFNLMDVCVPKTQNVCSVDTVHLCQGKCRKINETCYDDHHTLCYGYCIPNHHDCQD